MSCALLAASWVVNTQRWVEWLLLLARRRREEESSAFPSVVLWREVSKPPPCIAAAVRGALTH